MRSEANPYAQRYPLGLGLLPLALLSTKSLITFKNWYDFHPIRKQKMICTKKALTKTNSISDQKFNSKPKEQLISRWKKVDCKLIFQWVLAR